MKCRFDVGLRRDERVVNNIPNLPNYQDSRWIRRAEQESQLPQRKRATLYLHVGNVTRVIPESLILSPQGTTFGKNNNILVYCK